MKNFAASTRTSQRRGLAPLELVFVLPLLMTIMAVIIVFGYAASWKLRTETVARDTLWRERGERFAHRNAFAPEWPLDSSQSIRRAEPLNSITTVPVVSLPIIAGPIPAVNVNANRLDFTRGMQAGVAELNRDPPIFSSLTSFRFTVDHPLLTDSFQIWQMSSTNNSRKIPLIYEIGLDFIRSSGSLISAVLALENPALLSRLAALDNDPDFLLPGFRRNFVPQVPRFCESDPDVVQAQQVSRTIFRIQRLPMTLAQASIGLYRSQLNANPPPTAIRQMELERNINVLELWLITLEELQQGTQSN